MNALDGILAKVKGTEKRIVLPEGQDPRVIKAAQMAVAQGVCTVIVLGTPDEIAKSEAEAGVKLPAAVEVIDFTCGDLLDQLSLAFYEKRKAKGLTSEEARATLVEKRIYFGAMMLALDMVDGLVAGSIASTGDMLRAAFQCVGTAKGIGLASSTFIMDLKEPTESGDSVLFFADCAVNPNPTAEQLVDIAHATALTYQALIGKTPRVAFLSFSTKGSARHELVDKVALAAEMARTRFDGLGLNAIVDGEMQADTALVPAVGKSKNKSGVIQGDANVLVFPDLQAGNICYKMVQRLAGAEAIGPVIQGVAKPINDLSRGCSAEDIYGNIIITAAQAL